jgi:hypothetical protein
VMKDAILKLVETKVDGNKEKHELKAADQAKLGGYELTHNASSIFDETGPRPGRRPRGRASRGRHGQGQPQEGPRHGHPRAAGGRRPRGGHHQLRSPEAGALRRARSCRRRSRRRPY